MKRNVCALIFALFISGCSFSIQKNQEKAFPDPTQYSVSELAFSSVYDRIFRTSCVSCHGNSGGVNLESYQSIKQNLNKIYQSTVLEGRMPKLPTPALSADQMGLLNAWILAGAPESSGPGGTLPLPPLLPNFLSIKTHILEPRCLSCHSPGNSVARIPLVTREDLLNSPLELVIPGNAEESGLILAVRNEDPNKVMPPEKTPSGQPTGFSRLKEEEIRIIEEWIQRGAVE